MLSDVTICEILRAGANVELEINIELNSQF